ncbi:MAG: hypothetical protein HY917_00910 [Candidatus Diapherotrites archaeon]|nr:hypothetical protein [Candidatus Diapherotrites archaeon]
MNVITVFLGTLALALLIGNYFLSILTPKNPPIPQNPNPTPANESDSIQAESPEALQERLKNLEYFKANTLIELKALKEIVSTKKKEPKIKLKNSKAKPLDDKDLHKLVYRSREKNNGQ